MNPEPFLTFKTFLKDLITGVSHRSNFSDFNNGRCTVPVLPDTGAVLAISTGAVIVPVLDDKALPVLDEYCLPVPGTS